MRARLLLLLVLAAAPPSLSLTLRRGRRAGAFSSSSVERATLGASAGGAFNGVLDGMSWPAPPPVNDKTAAPLESAAVLARRREGVRQRMVLAQGTTVTIWGPEALTEAQLADHERFNALPQAGQGRVPRAAPRRRLVINESHRC